MPQIMSESEYRFPYKKDGVLILMLSAILQASAPQIMGKTLNWGTYIADWIAKKFFDSEINPEKYLVKAKNAAGGSISADAMVSMRLGKTSKEANSAQQPHTSTEYFTRRDEGSKDIEDLPYFGKLLKDSATANIHYGHMLGAEMDVLERDPETNEIIKAKGALFGEMSYGATANIPLLPQIGKNKNFVVKSIFMFDAKSPEK